MRHLGYVQVWVFHVWCRCASANSFQLAMWRRRSEADRANTNARHISGLCPPPVLLSASSTAFAINPDGNRAVPASQRSSAATQQRCWNLRPTESAFPGIAILNSFVQDASFLDGTCVCAGLWPAHGQGRGRQRGLGSGNYFWSSRATSACCSESRGKGAGKLHTACCLCFAWPVRCPTRSAKCGGRNRWWTT